MTDFIEACKLGNLDKAKSIVQANPEQNIHAESDFAFQLACMHGHLEVAQWLVNYVVSIKSPIDIHAESDFAFRWACWAGHLDLAQRQVVGEKLHRIDGHLVLPDKPADACDL